MTGHGDCTPRLHITISSYAIFLRVEVPWGKETVWV